MTFNSWIFDCVIFDMDGVIVDTGEDVTGFWTTVAERTNVRLEPDDFTNSVYGVPATDTLRILFPKLNERQRQEILLELREYESSLPFREVAGATSLLRSLRDSGASIGLVTSADRDKVGLVIDNLGLDGVFSSVVTSQDVVLGKPNPEPYLLAASMLDTSPSKCIVFEDSVSGIQAARSAHSTIVGVGSRPNILLEAGACCTVANFVGATLDNNQASGLARLSLPGSMLFEIRIGN